MKRVATTSALKVALLFALVIVAYRPVARQAGFIWDDDDYVINNQTLRSADGLRRIWLEPGATRQYYPLVHTTFWVEYQLWGLRPTGYHVVNILLHAANAALLWALLRRLNVRAAWMIAAVFALHPVHVESVAWITERKNVLSGFFYLGSLLTYLRFAESGARGQGRRGLYGAAFALFVCALLAKTVTATLPAAILLLLWWKNGRLGRADVLALIPMFVVGAGLGLLTLWMEKHSVGATGPEWALTALERCLIAGRALWFYAGKLVWPQRLTFIYPRWQIETGVWWQYAFPAAALLVIAALWMLRGRIGRGPLASVLFFAGTLVPALGFFNVYPFRFSFVADHFQYLASIGVIALCVAGVAHIARAMRAAKSLVWAGGACVLAVLGALTWQQGGIYRNSETLWRDTLAKNPDSWMAAHHLAAILVGRGEFSAAAGLLRRAVEIKPDNAEAHNDLGLVYLRLGQPDEARRHLETAVRLAPHFAEAHANLGGLLIAGGWPGEARTHLQTALRLRPDSEKVMYNLAVALNVEGRKQEAAAMLRRLLQKNPRHANAHFLLGVICEDTGQDAKAMEHLRESVRLNPGDAEARYRLAALLQKSGGAGARTP